MFNFINNGLEFNNLAKSMNGMNVMIQELIPKLERSLVKSEFEEDVLVLAYISKKGVFDRLEKYNWTMNAKMFVPTIERGRITLSYALSQTVGKISMLAAELDMSDIVQEIMDGGDAFYELERQLPDQLKNSV